MVILDSITIPIILNSITIPVIEDLEKKQIQEMKTSDAEEEVILITETMHHKLIQK